MKHSKPILPLLVNGARMPNESELPDSLRELSSYNAAKVDSGQDFVGHGAGATSRRPITGRTIIFVTAAPPSRCLRSR